MNWEEAGGRGELFQAEETASAEPWGRKELRRVHQELTKGQGEDDAKLKQ